MKGFLLAGGRNMHAIPGTEMFVQQGARQFEIWSRPAPVSEMQRVVECTLAQRAAGKAEKKKAKK